MKNYQPNLPGRGRSSWRNSALAGFLATIPMTLFLLTTQRVLPKGQQYALPPELLTRELSQSLHLPFHLKKKQIVVVSLASHFGYGTMVGALYHPLEKRL